MFGWFRKRCETPQPLSLQPEARWSISVDDDSIRTTDEAGVMKAVLKRDLCGVIIETNDSGPWGADVWWLLFGADDHVALAYPQGAAGEEALIDYLTALPGFDHSAMIEAMGSTENAVFPVWRRAI